MPNIIINEKVLKILNKYYEKNNDNPKLQDFIIGYQDNLTNYTLFLYNFKKSKRVSTKKLFDVIRNDKDLDKTLNADEIKEIEKYLK